MFIIHLFAGIASARPSSSILFLLSSLELQPDRKNEKQKQINCPTGGKDHKILEPFELLLIVLIAFITACISGVTGVAGGLLPAIFLTPIVGITTIMPVLGVMLKIGMFFTIFDANFEPTTFRL